MQQAEKRKCPHHPVTASQQESRKSCCDTTVDFLQLEDEQLAQNATLLNLTAPALVTSLQVALGVLAVVEEDHKTYHYRNYKPPLLVCDLPVSFQTFLC